MTVNPLLDFAKYAGDPRKMLFIKDVDLAIQPSMCTKTTEEQKAALYRLYDMTHGGVLIFTGRTPQSARETFGYDYPGAFEHYTLSRWGLGQTFLFMAPKVDIETMATHARTALGDQIVIAANPDEIRQNSNEAVFIEKKNASIALVHTTLQPAFTNDPRPLDHLKSVRRILVPAAERIIEEMGISETHTWKQGNDAVEIVPKGLDANTEAKKHLSDDEINRIQSNGLSKATALHNFRGLYDDRIVHMLGDGAPDMDVAVEIKKHYDGWGTYVSNGVPLMEKYNHAVLNNRDEQSIIAHHTMTWGMIQDTADALFDAMRKTKPPLPPEGGMTPNLSQLH